MSLGAGKETETLDKLYLEWSQITSARTAREIQLQHDYDELIMAVSRKYQGESRHKTALRYIRVMDEPPEAQ